MPSTVSNFKLPFKVFAFEPLHVSLNRTPIGATAILIPVEDLEIGQTFSPSYQKSAVYGRMDPIVTYKNTTRSMQISFKCQAHHVFDKPSGVINNIRNINVLTQLLYPTYFQHGTTVKGDPAAILGAPPFFRIRYGNYVGSFDQGGSFMGESESGITGYIESFQHKLGRIPKNVAFGKQGNDAGYRALPREIGVTFTFHVIHDKLVGWYNGEFSPNGYGYNFPYNAGEFGRMDARTRMGSSELPPGANSTSIGSVPPAASAADITNDPHSVNSKVANAQLTDDLNTSAHTDPKPTSA